MSVHLIAGLPAILVIACKPGHETLVLVSADQPWRRIVAIVQLVLPRAERREVYRALLAC